jgi:hypothetical protein
MVLGGDDDGEQADENDQGQQGEVAGHDASSRKRAFSPGQSTQSMNGGSLART